MIFTGTGNANKILGIPVQTGTPSDTFTLLYDAASNRWIFGPSGTPPAGGVGGGANLTTVGSVPFVTAAGVLGQSANLFWDNANARLGVGTNAPQRTLHVQTSGTTVSALVQNASGQANLTFQGTTFGQFENTVGDLFFTNNSAAGHLVFRVNGTEGMRLASTSRNLLLGTTTDDGSNRLQVAGSIRLAAAGSREILMRDTNGSVEMQLLADTASLNIGVKNVTNLWSINSSGTNTLYNQTPTVGSTSLIVRAGAGQGSNQLVRVRNSADTLNLFSVESTGRVTTDSSYDSRTDAFAYGTSASLASGGRLTFSPNVSTYYTPDLSLSRASANTLQVGDGGSNSNGIILSRRVQSAGETVASLPAAAAGNAGTISYVTDSNSTTIGATVAGGGANRVLVWSNGTAWRIFAN